MTAPMKTILCYGDSITWGSNPEAGGARHARADRWPEVMRAALGPGHHVMAEGLRGRTTAYDEHLADCDRNGARLLPTILYTHAPLDLVILMLGSNDMKPTICGTAIGALQGMRRCVEIVQRYAPRLPGVPAPQVLLVSPPALVETADTFYADLFKGGVAESAKLAGLYAALAAEMGCAFFDAGSVATASPIDGVHCDAANTRAMGAEMARTVAEICAKTTG